MMLWKIAVVTFIFLSSGCSQDARELKSSRKSEPIKWVNVGTLVSVAPDMESTRRPGRVGSAVLGETKLSRTCVETTKGVYIISDKIGIVETGIPVSIGYDASDEYSDAPSYLSFGGERYKIVR
jgi:hypothetical protein